LLATGPKSRMNPALEYYFMIFSNKFTFKFVRSEGPQPRLVIMLILLVQQVGILGLQGGETGRRTVVAIDGPLAQGHRLVRSVLRPEPDRPAQNVVSVERECTLAVSSLDDIASGVDDRAPQACIDALDPQGVIGKVIYMSDCNPPQRVGDGKYVALDVVGRLGRVPCGRQTWAIARYGLDHSS